MEPHEQEIQTCLAINDNGEAWSCLKNAVSKYADDDSICRPKLVLLVQKGCAVCKQEAAVHAADINNGIIKKVESTSPEGQAIMRNNDIDLVPAILLLDCNNQIIDPV